MVTQPEDASGCSPFPTQLSGRFACFTPGEGKSVQPGRGVEMGPRRERQPPAPLGSPSEPRALPALGSDPQSHPVRRGPAAANRGALSGSPDSRQDRPRRARGPAQGLPGDDPGAGCSAHALPWTSRALALGWFSALFALKPRGAGSFPAPCSL